MNTFKLAALAILMTFGAAAADEVEVEKKMEIKVMVSGDGEGDATEMHWISNDMDFEMEDLAVGESRALETESGKSVTITRAEEGFSFDVDGKTIMLPGMGGHGSHMAFIGEPGKPGAPMDIDVEMSGGPHIMRAHHPEGITIVSGKPLDDSVKESIRSVLISAGNGEEVTFIDGSEDGRHVMMKKIEIIQ
jgi:hypothetical protein